MDLKEAKSLLDDRFSRDLDFLEEIKATLNMEPESKILDVGTGRGNLAIFLALDGFEIITGEPNGDNWADWETNVNKLNLSSKIKFHYFNAEDLPFNDANFNYIYAYLSFHHIPKKMQAIYEFNRVLNHNGVITIIEFTEKGVEFIRKTRPNHPKAVCIDDFISSNLYIEQILKSKDGLLVANIIKKNDSF